MKIQLFFCKFPVILGLTLIVVSLNIYLFCFQFTTISQNQYLLGKSLAMSSYLESFRSALDRSEIAGYSYLTTSEDRSWQQYYQEVGKAQVNLQNLQLQGFIGETKTLAQQLAQLNQTWERKIELSQYQFLSSVNSKHDNQNIEQAKAVIDTTITKLKKRSQLDLQKSQQGLQVSLICGAIATAINFGLMGWLLYHLRLSWLQHQRDRSQLHQQAILLETIGEAVFIQDLNQGISHCNQAAETLYGWQREKIFGENILDVIPGDNLSVPVMDAILAKGYWQGEIQQINGNCQNITVNSRWKVIYDERGHPQSIVIVNRDITAQKHLESIMLRSQRLEMIGTLAGGVAHDLNNILSPILLSLQLLGMKLSDRDKKLFKTLENNVKRGSNLVKQVLSLARGTESKHTCIDVYGVLTDVEEFINETFPKSIYFCSRIGKNLASIRGNSCQLYQVFMNLAINARDAMPEGGQIELDAQVVEINHQHHQHLKIQPGTYIAISISDNGIGMTSKVRDRIFEPFFTTKQLDKGTGLGLYSAQVIVRNHGGTMVVDTNLGQGSRFQVYLPALNQSPSLQSSLPQLSVIGE